MSYQIYPVKCDRCGYETQTAFGIVGTTQIAAPITDCPTQFPSRSLDVIQRCGGKMVRIDRPILLDNGGSFGLNKPVLINKELRVIQAAKEWYKAWMQSSAVRDLTVDISYELAEAVKALDDTNEEGSPSQDLQ